MIRDIADRFPLWQINAASFAMAWWLFVAPSANRWLWARLIPAPLPSAVDSLLSLCWLWILLGFVFSMGALCSNFKRERTLQSAANWFIWGVLSLPLWAGLLSCVGFF